MFSSVKISFPSFNKLSFFNNLDNLRQKWKILVTRPKCSRLFIKLKPYMISTKCNGIECVPDQSSGWACAVAAIKFKVRVFHFGDCHVVSDCEQWKKWFSKHQVRLFFPLFSLAAFFNWCSAGYYLYWLSFLHF